MKKNNILHLLHLEDNDNDSKLVQNQLKNAEINFVYYLVDNQDDFQQNLKKNNIDIILSDYFLPSYSGTDALKYVWKNYPKIPFIFVSGVIDEDTAIESLRHGATDYVFKNKLDRLAWAVRRAYMESREIEARKEAELLVSKLLSAVEQSSNIILITDTDGIIEYVNSAALKSTGYSKEEIIGKNPRIFNSGKTAMDEYKYLWQAIKSGKEWKGEFRNRKKNGDLYWERATITPIVNDLGQITNFIAIKEDVTEQKKLTTELVKAKEKAEEGDRLKTAFLNNISHEIRTPMNAIVGFSNFLNKRDIPKEKVMFYSEIIIKSSQQLLSIITDIINIAAIEAGQERLNEQWVRLNPLLSVLYEQYLLKSKEKKIQLEYQFSFSDNNDLILVDETKFSQILSNLLNNAIKFTISGKVTFGYNLKNNEIEFFVVDTGIGIPIDMREEIFKRFRQVESTTTRQFGGSGLGLSIAKAYVELLDGRIWLRSEPGKGTTFYFTIPYKPTGYAL